VSDVVAWIGRADASVDIGSRGSGGPYEGALREGERGGSVCVLPEAGRDERANGEGDVRGVSALYEGHVGGLRWLPRCGEAGGRGW